MTNFIRSREKDLQKLISQDYELLQELEQKRSVSSDPKEQRRLDTDIEQTQKSLEKHNYELRGLQENYSGETSIGLISAALTLDEVEKSLSKKGVTLLKTLQNRATLSNYYAIARNEWKPFGEETISDLFHETASRLGININLHTEDFFGSNFNLRDNLCDRLGETGCIIVVDALALFSPSVSNILVETLLVGSYKTGFICILPSIPNKAKAREIVKERLNELGLGKVVRRYNQQFHANCILDVDDIVMFKRALQICFENIGKPLPSATPSIKVKESVKEEFQEKEKPNATMEGSSIRKWL